MTKLYIAEFSYGKARLATVELVRETPKIYIVERSAKEDFLGFQFLSERLYKNKHHCFFTAEDALDYLLSETDQYISNLEAALVKAKVARKDLAQTKETLKGVK